MNKWFVIVPVALAVIAGVAGVLIEWVYLSDYASHWWNEIPAFYLLYGLGSAAVTLLIAKGLQRLLVQSDEGGKS
jgi:hypothetical protein